MSDTSYRPNRTVTEPKNDSFEGPKDKSVPAGITEVEPPFTDYETEKGKPFAVDYFELGDLWDRGDMYSEGYVPEVKAINEYLTYAIKNGDLNNTVESVRNEFKRIEKMINVRPDQRKSARLSLVAEYVRFLMRSDYIKKESAKSDMI